MAKKKNRSAAVTTAGDGSPGQEDSNEEQVRQRKSLDDLFRASYRELSRQAACIRRAGPHATISTSTLVHETWLKLASSQSLQPVSGAHLKHIVAKAMRQFAIQDARGRHALKRDAPLVTLDDSLQLAVARGEDLLALDEALDKLAGANRRHAELVELRVFGGYEFAEIAAILEISKTTAERDWKASRAWLAAQMRRES
jgi:RNA polymerase sigma factor (TIGR02999 family)